MKGCPKDQLLRSLATVACVLSCAAYIQRCSGASRVILAGRSLIVVEIEQGQGWDHPWLTETNPLSAASVPMTVVILRIC